MQNTFPVDAVIPELCSALAGHGRAILTASPGSGKTTRVPLALLGLLPGVPHSARPAPVVPGKILVLEPRRLAARASARYMAHLLGEPVGQRVGYRVRLESKVSQATQVELLTEGMFTRRLLADPELTGVSCVIFDEFHERSLQADLGLALCLECVEALRPDLFLLVMSATLDTEGLSHFLGDCPIITAKGANWPVQVRHAGREGVLAPGATVDEVAHKSAAAVRESLRNEPGNILVFLPGQAEIRQTAALLETRPNDTDLHPLYGDLPLREQDAAIAPPPAGRRKVVLATDLAQTSLTIEGVRLVIDAGLSRSPRFDPATGLSRLVTSRVTQDAADQRAGRAGRLEPGICLRLWPEGEHLLAQARPEIVDTDLAPLYLDALAWGSEPASLPWLTPPPDNALRNALETLHALDAVRTGPEGRPHLTAHGEQLARLPLHPRLAHMVVRAAEQEQDLSSLAACLAALVSERDPLRKSGPGNMCADIRLRLPLLKLPENRRIREAAEQIHRLSGLQRSFRLPQPEEEDCCGMLLSLAWPERIAQQRVPGSFRLASGQGAELPAHDPLAREQWLGTASLGNGVNRRIHLAAPLAFADIMRLHAGQVRTEEQIFWETKTEAVFCRSVNLLGALTLEEKALPPAQERGSSVQKALLEGIISLGISCLPWTDELRQLQARVLLLRTYGKAPEDCSLWPDMSDAALMRSLQAAVGERAEAGSGAWLTPWLEGITRRTQFAGIDLAAALHALLPWPLPDRLDKEAPKRLDLPSGSSAQVDYLPVLRGDLPVLAVKLQEMFGQTDTPRLANGCCPVMLHLLSPAGRPLQVTGDLRHFWENGYKQVRAEMRGRYPKHPWPEDPLTAQPTGKTKKRLERATLAGKDAKKP